MDDKQNSNQTAPSSTSNENKALKTKLANPRHWIRLVLMLLMFTILFYLVKFIVSITLIVQWVLVLLSGEPNARLKGFSKSLNRYGYQIMEYVSFNSDERPFPLSDWPEAGD